MNCNNLKELPGKRQWFIVVTKGRSRPDGTFHFQNNCKKAFIVYDKQLRYQGGTLRYSTNYNSQIYRKIRNVIKNVQIAFCLQDTIDSLIKKGLGAQGLKDCASSLEPIRPRWAADQHRTSIDWHRNCIIASANLVHCYLCWFVCCFWTTSVGKLNSPVNIDSGRITKLRSQWLNFSD